MPPNDEIPGGPDHPTVWLVIPYFPGDMGRVDIERPLTDAVAISWLCKSIIVDGQAGVFSFERGQPMTVTIDVANWGAGSMKALANVKVWWTEPTAGFAQAHDFGQTSVIVPPGGQPVTSPPMVNTIPLTAQPHVCLLARVTATTDGVDKGKTPDPIGDRHWAQANLTEVSASADGVVTVPFQVGNPFAEEMNASFEVSALSEGEVAGLREILNRDIRTAVPEDLQIKLARGESALDGFAVPPRSQTPFELRGRVEPGGTAYFKIVQRLTTHGERAMLEGSLGVGVSFG